MRSFLVLSQADQSDTSDLSGIRKSSHVVTWAFLFDLAAVLLLVAVAAALRWPATRGDLWLDEADYALASVRGFQANRLDLPEDGDPARILRLRHYHPPLIAHVIGLASRWDRDDRTLRVPSIVAGSLTVAVLYLCGLYLFAPRGDPESRWAARLIALACAALLLAAPAHIRASSHALPWAFITLWLVCLATALAAYGRTRHPGWLVALGGALGLLFATSEYLVVALLGVGLGLPLVLWADLRERSRRKLVGWGLLGGLGVFLAIAWLLWPAGLRGGMVTMLEHYVLMADDSWPVRIAGTAYDRAPKWAYAYWYWTYYPGYAVWYALGPIGIALIAVTRRPTTGGAAVCALTAVLLAAAHKSHIIGPEYFVHVLPFLGLFGGLLFAQVARTHPIAGGGLAITGAVAVMMAPICGILSGMDARSQVSRWPAAAAYLKSQWRVDTRMLAPAYGGVGRWYVVHGAGVRANEEQVGPLPAVGARDSLVREVASGTYDYVAVGSTFADWQPVDGRIRQILARWPVVWKSDEQGTGPSRLVIYASPAGMLRRVPLPIL